jgi:hypothetical protein
MSRPERPLASDLVMGALAALNVWYGYHQTVGIMFDVVVGVGCSAVLQQLLIRPMTVVRIAWVALLVVLGVGLLTRITNRAGMPPKEPARIPLKIRADQYQPRDRDGGPEHREHPCANSVPGRSPERQQRRDPATDQSSYAGVSGRLWVRSANA